MKEEEDKRKARDSTTEDIMKRVGFFVKKRPTDADFWEKIEKSNIVTGKQRGNLLEVFKSKMNTMVEIDRHSGKTGNNRIQDFKQRHRLLHYIYPESYDEHGERRYKSVPPPERPKKILQSPIEVDALDVKNTVSNKESKSGQPEKNSDRSKTPEGEEPNGSVHIIGKLSEKKQPSALRKSEDGSWSGSKKTRPHLPHLGAHNSSAAGQTIHSGDASKNDFNFTPTNKQVNQKQSLKKGRIPLDLPGKYLSNKTIIDEVSYRDSQLSNNELDSDKRLVKNNDKKSANKIKANMGAGFITPQAATSKQMTFKSAFAANSMLNTLENNSLQLAGERRHRLHEEPVKRVNRGSSFLKEIDKISSKNSLKQQSDASFDYSKPTMLVVSPEGMQEQIDSLPKVPQKLVTTSRPL